MEPLPREPRAPAAAAVEAPAPTLAPAAVAAGAALVGYGIVTNVAFVVLGVVLLGGGLAAWIAALRHEHEPVLERGPSGAGGPPDEALEHGSRSDEPSAPQKGGAAHG